MNSRAPQSLWRYDFTAKGIRRTKARFDAMKEAQKAEAKTKKDIAKPKPNETKPTDMDFLELVNRKPDQGKDNACNTESFLPLSLMVMS